MRRVLLASLVIAVAATSSGCYEFNAFVHSPFGPGTLCDTTHCGDCGPCGGGRPCGPPYYGTWGFGPTWGCGPAACCEPSCDPGAGCGDCCGIATGCGESAVGDPCGSDCDCGCCDCGGCGCSPGPVMCVLSLLRPSCWFGCNHNGCGEIYWGDFHGDPPDCCDPCDRMGNFTGCSNCGGEPADSGYDTPSPDTPFSPEAIEPNRVPTKAPVKMSRNSTKNRYYSSQRHQSRARY